MQKEPLSLNKSLAANTAAVAVLACGLFSPWQGDLLITIGLFSLSGGITNWIAIHMLFNKVPFLYGSGVITERFSDFKKGIRSLILEEFFTLDDIAKFRRMSSSKATDEFLKTLDMDKIYEGLIDAITKSSLGPSINLFGGPKMLESLRDPIKVKLQEIIKKIGHDESEKIGVKNAEKLREEIIKIVDGRLNDLTPQNVKQIIEDIIRKHLGWLVVWGAFFGGLLGAGFGVLTEIV